MPTIYIETTINASIEKVFDLNRDIDLHQKSTEETNERAIAGKISGLIELNETVTWRAKHLGVYQDLTSKITRMNFPSHFTSKMQKGAFKSMEHQHIFIPLEKGTLMIDVFQYQSPFGILGKIADFLFLKKYMKRLLTKQNTIIKNTAEK